MVAAELDAASLGRGQGRLGALGNHFGFVLGDRRQDVDGEPVRLRKVHSDEIDRRRVSSLCHRRGIFRFA
jgi:hypothetical protein